MSISYLKGLKTRYKNLLEAEIKKAQQLLTAGVSDWDLESQIRKVNGCYNRLHEFGPKLEETIERLSLSIEEAKSQDETKKFESESNMYFNLLSEVSSFKDELKMSESNLTKRHKAMSQTESDNKFDRLIDLQTQMLQHLQLQQTEREQTGTTTAAASSVRLPKLEIMAYSGDKQKYQEFWDQFECTIHKNTKLSNVEKFTYLKGKLYGMAQSAISGLTLTNENYDVAIGILKERFGDTQTAVNAHYVELINLSQATNRTTDLRVIYDKIEQNLRSLEALGQNVDQDVFISMITLKLPRDVMIQLEIQKGTGTKWSVAKLRDLLKAYLSARESAESHSKDKPNEQKTPSATPFTASKFKPSLTNQVKIRSSAEALVTGSHERGQSSRYSPKKPCIYCQGSHWSDECTVYKTVEDRKRKLVGLCFVCLKPGHRLRDCTSDKACFYCKKTKKHHQSLCLRKFPSVRNEISNLSEEPAETEVVSEETLLSSGDIVLMQTAKTLISNPSSSEKTEIRLLLDSGSQRTYITDTLARKLKLKYKTIETISVVTFGSDKPKNVKTPKVECELALANGTVMKIDANVVPKITGSILRRPLQIDKCNNWDYLWSKFSLADTLPTVKETSTIELLIGNDYYLDIVLPEKFEIQTGLYLLGSKLGWIISGRASGNFEDHEEQTMLILNYMHGPNYQQLSEISVVSNSDPCLSLKPPLDDFWNLETIGISEPCDVSDDAKALSNFDSSVKYENGRYFVTWPWKTEQFELMDNKELAFGRFRSLLHRLRNKPELLEKYNDIIEEQNRNNVIEKVDTTKTEELVHYIPHHAVVDSSKPTTKVRIVYDASAKSRQENNSLNDCLYRGPVMLKDLCGLLLRFRLHKYTVVADIEKAFLQLGLQDKDRDVTRFYWIKDKKQPLFDINNVQIYRCCRVPFGIVSSPFLLAATVDFHLRHYDSVEAEKLRENLYVDNLLTGADSEDDLLTLYDKAKDIFENASMNLRDWSSNSKAFMSSIPQNDCGNRNSVKVLGILWKIIEDKLTIPKPKSVVADSPHTKREILQSIASVYDPLGYFTPVTLLGKLFLQSLWIQQMKWDDILTDEDKETWKGIATDLKNIPQCEIDRYIGLDGESVYQLLCFCDASKKAYACAIYLRQETRESCRTDLIFSKSRLAPIKNKNLTIPRLELLAVIIGLRSLKYVQNQLKITVQKKVLWSDSQCVLFWIASNKPMSTFVDNRLKEVKQYSDVEFRYVSTHENPADVASRGKLARELESDTLWWNGPQWLMCAYDEWPVWKYDMTPQENKLVESEYKKTSQSQLLAGETPSGTADQKSNFTPPFGINYEKYSKFVRLLRITAWVMRFIRKLKKETVSGPLTAKEIDQARFRWITFMQRKHFSNEIDLLGKKKSNNLIRQLGLTIDNCTGLIRCVGRLEYAEIAEEAKRPILIPKKDHFTNLLIESYHRKLLHVGVSQTLSQIRHKYWIPRGRAVVRNVLRSCRNCIRYEGGPYKMPLFPPLPSKRVSESVPYTFTGIDYFGPLYVKTDNETKKAWVCLYTCLVVRAIHLELMLDMSTEQFLLGFRRFVARCGTPKQITSDNAMQFKAACNVVEQEWSDVISDQDTLNYVSDKGIEWKFIVELAPWMGGFYERLVGLVKRSLRKTMGKSCFNIEQLRTLLTEVEAVVNCRPLVYIGDDISSQTVLTPSCFMTLNKMTGIPERSDDAEDPEFKPHMSSKDNLLLIWKKGQKHINRFWQIWKDDYLLSLRERTAMKLKQKRKRSFREPKMGDIVLIKEDLPRGIWKIGKIVDLPVSYDGHIRSAKLLLPTKRFINRTLNFLYPLECDEISDDMDVSENPELDSKPNDNNHQCIQSNDETVKPTRRAAI